MEILVQADAAMKSVDLVSYNANYEGTGWVKAFVPHVEGEVIQGPKSKYDIDQFYAEVKLNAYDSDEVTQCTVGTADHEPREDHPITIQGEHSCFAFQLPSCA